MGIEWLKALSKDQIAAQTQNLSAADLKLLVETLNEKDDKLRYNAFLLLQAYSKQQPLVYEYWAELEKKLGSGNSYQRSLGAMLIAENVRWDKDGKFAKLMDKYMACCNDEKFITARQTIQGLGIIIESTGKYKDAIKQALAKLTFTQYKDNQQKLLQKDVLIVLKLANK
jgi:hypothetical protein